MPWGGHRENSGPLGHLQEACCPLSVSMMKLGGVACGCARVVQMYRSSAGGILVF